MLLQYEQFIKNKIAVSIESGFDVNRSLLNKKLFDYQKDIVRWSLKKGRSAIFADCGLGKTLMQLEFAQQIINRVGGKVLIIAPLAVTGQTKLEGQEFGYDVNICESQEDVIDGINITNYEKLDRFVGNKFVGVVLDESSILKSFTGKIRDNIINIFRNTPYKLACTATPSPNDYMELGNHSEFLGVMTRTEMLSMYFIHDSGETSKWRLKGHAEDVFWEWMSSWAVVLDNPRNLGYDIQGFDLPKLNIHQIIVDGDSVITEKQTLTQRRQARKDSLKLRCKAASELVNESDEQWLVWCDLNAESEMLHKLINSSYEIKGSDKAKYKTETMIKFSDGSIKCLVTKPKIAGFGMNWQQCHNMIFVGLSDSYEAYYQAVRRCWRFGQTHEVNVYIIISAREGAVKENIERKEVDAENMKRQMLALTKEITKKNLERTTRIMTAYEPNVRMRLPNWEEMS
ncbi:helicase-related protein [Peptostreptococcus sp. D1]|uniref:helicase-related protein n=1 Tax=Peptostreptococcus sp. D1 TaxID=72304 RepID=UPI0008F25D89|nr:DEAD/DEAH box helicase [Peptostreptococcus sp. D1]SFE84573.1 Superfamily II DNA or RNA helicase [Peptostreptococcus sp. D1]